MNKLELEPLANYTGWSFEQIRRYRNLTALKFLLRMQQTKKIVMTKFSLLILFRLFLFCPVQRKDRDAAKYLIDNRRHLSFSEAFRVIFQFNCIALRRSILISIEHARTFSISINGTAFPGLCSNFTEFFQTRFQC